MHVMKRGRGRELTVHAFLVSSRHAPMAIPHVGTGAVNDTRIDLRPEE
jgi:hypothetical protein